ncbi:BrnA antitoxin family protein [Zavarzinia aquatilis]|uniref:BrnA antitoxin family protein n=1 Tax=Zavarzinia aquatilis TaxID=2211142 RepID=A0A317E8C9_9PROT|nr:BrnA antitoxin family protein [Zavarzinia aquatilis]PWR22520.1 hypothetical protein DKG74_11635 [Zavarzinia aquatilis]
MTARKKLLTSFEPGHGFTREDWDEVEAVEASFTDEDLKAARPFAEVFPDLAESLRRNRGRPKSDSPKVSTTIRLSQAVLDHFKAGGPGWQTRIDEALKKAAGIE